MGERHLHTQPNNAAIEGSVRMIDLPYLLMTLLLVAIGLVMLFSASYVRAYENASETDGVAAYYFTRQAVFAIIGIAAMLVISRIPYRHYRKLAIPLYALSVILLFGVLLSTEINGAKRWFTIFGIQFQPSEIAKLSIILLLASMISVYKEQMRTVRYGVLYCMAILIVPIALLYLEPHLSCIIILCGIAGVLMFLGGIKFRYVGILILLLAGFFAWYMTQESYAGARWANWQDPTASATTGGYQTIQSLYAIGSGGMWGLGLGKSRQKYLYLPEEHNDYIFAVVCEELGFVGASLIILLFIFLILRGYWIALHAKDQFGRLIGFGIVTQFALQVFFNIGVVTGLLPSTGISLPFFSYGGTALVIQLAEMGIVLNISRYTRPELL